jgi:hypothetical protein
MSRGRSLTISGCSKRKRGRGAVLACLLLGACTIEVGPPPEADPPLVPQTAKAPPPPAQPSEPQAWARGLDLDDVPVAADRGQMAEGLVAGDAQTNYSGQRLTFESAFNPEKPPTEAELALQRARERAAAAGRPAPPQVAAVPLTEVESQALPSPDTAAQAPAPRRESRLPPPPKFMPPAAPEEAEVTKVAAAPAAAEARKATATTPEQWAQRGSRLPPPPTFPPRQPAEAAQAAAATPADAPAAPPLEAAVPEAQADPVAGSVDEAWDAPSGTILVQISAVPDGGKVSEEWERLRARYPQVLKPLRLVVEQASLGERGIFYRVQAGAFSTEEGAAEACEKLIGQGQACFVVVR